MSIKRLSPHVQKTLRLAIIVALLALIGYVVFFSTNNHQEIGRLPESSEESSETNTSNSTLPGSSAHVPTTEQTTPSGDVPASGTTQGNTPSSSVGGGTPSSPTAPSPSPTPTTGQPGTGTNPSTPGTSPTQPTIPPASSVPGTEAEVTSPVDVHTPSLPTNNVLDAHLRFEVPPDMTVYAGQPVQFVTRAENLDSPQDIPYMTVLTDSLPALAKTYAYGPSTTGLFSWGWYTDVNDPGEYEIVIHARTAGIVREESFHVTVLPAADFSTKAPEITTAPVAYIAYPGEERVFVVTAYDPDSDEEDLSWMIFDDGGADGLELTGSVDASHGSSATIRFTPDTNDIGNLYSISIGVGDNHQFFAFYDTMIRVQERVDNTPQPPTSTLLYPSGGTSPIIIPSSTSTPFHLSPLQLR